MSKANSAIKVLRTALKRVTKGWTQHVWSFTDPVTGQTFVCLEGGLFGYCDQNKHGLTDAQKQARDACLEVIKDRYQGRFWSIPTFNDEPGRTQEEVQEVIKLAIIRLETTGGEASDEEDFDDLLDFIDLGG
jgi:hypothetical protein